MYVDSGSRIGGHNMWALVWFKVIVGLGVEHYHLNSYNTLAQCEVALDRAAVMKTSGNIKIACLEVKVSN
jgi:hypothetical protein|tara:strand:+ start:357 stop:566 length:210 start_codon:yes stop_codon:yes gene_type:complete